MNVLQLVNTKDSHERCFVNIPEWNFSAIMRVNKITTNGRRCFDSTVKMHNAYEQFQVSSVHK